MTSLSSLLIQFAVAGAILTGLTVWMKRHKNILWTFLQHFVGVWFPNLINLEQFRLLFQDNVGDAAATERLLGRAPHSTLAFWEAEATGEALEEESLRVDVPELVGVAVE